MQRRRSAILATLAGAAVVALVASGCSGSKKQAEAPTTTTSSSTTTTSPIGPPPALRLAPVATFEAPTAMAQRSDDGAFYVAERAGRVRVLRDGVIGSTPVLDISSETTVTGERGLLGLTFAPGSRLFYVYYTDKAGAIHITEFTLGANDVVDMHTRRDLLTIEHPRDNHNGGQLAFGPDGYLYIGVGDGGGSGDPDKNSQNLTVLLGKILRIDPKATTTTPYTVPYDNPFVKQAGARGEIWAYGLRNPWRFSFDSTEKGIWIADVGQDKREEINHVDRDAKGGQNYGWPLREGTQRFTADKPNDALDPVHEYAHDGGACSVTGGYVYRGKTIAGLQGRYLFGDFCTGVMSTLTEKGSQWNADVLNVTLPKLQSFGQDREGELYALAYDGRLLRIEAGAA